jgi:hypothetical protein
MTGPCAWPVSYAQCGPCPTLDELDEQDRVVYEQMAAAFLWNWTGRALGLCEVTLRPCRADCRNFGSGRAPWEPALIAGKWYNISCGQCGGDTCSCNYLTPALILPGPIHSVEEILIDGEVVDPGTYRVQNRRMLVRDGAAWPICQNMGLPSTAPGTWQVTYTRGVEVPPTGQAAAGILACELAKAMCNDSTCRLPQRLQSISRQGVTIAVLDTFEDVKSGRTGIWFIDSWVASLTQPPMPGRVYSVDVPRPNFRTQTWPTT